MSARTEAAAQWGAVLDQWCEHQRQQHPANEWAYCPDCRSLLDELDELAYAVRRPR